MDNEWSDEKKQFSLWEEYLIHDKRGFDEYFSEEFGFTCDVDISYEQRKLLCEKLIGGK